MLLRLRNILSHSGFKRYSAHLSWMFAARIFTLGVSFLATIVIARALGPSNFGELDYALAIVGLFSTVANFGTSEVLYRELINRPGQQNELLGTALGLRIAAGAVSALAVVAFALLTPVDTVSRILLIILSGMLPLDALALFSQVSMAEANAKIPSLISMGGWVVAAIVKIIFIASGKGAIWIAAAYILEHSLYGVAYVFAYRYFSHADGRLTFSGSLVPTFLKTGSALLLTGVFAMALARIDQVFIRMLLGAEAVGLYSAGVRLVEIANILPAAFVTGLYPAVLGARKTGEHVYARRVRLQFLVLAVCGALVCLFLAILAHPLFALLFGNAFLPGVHAFRVYTLSIPATFIVYKINDVLYTDDLRKGLIATTGLPAILNILLNVFWIPKYGIIGAAWATTIALYCALIVPFLLPRSRQSLFKLFHPGQP